MSNSDNEEDATIDIQNKGLTELPVNEPDWSRAIGIFLQDNEITELNADILPRTLVFLDLTGNPIVKVTGTFPDTLSSLVLTRTKIENLGLLPEALTELVINDTPMARKYGIDSDVRDKAKMKRLSGIPFEEGSIMVDNTPEGREINSNSNSEISFNNNNSVNQNYIDGGSRAAYNSDDTRHLVMIISRIEDEKDIKYKVETLNEGEKIVLKQHLEPYEPRNADAIQPLPLTNPPTVYTKEGHGEDILFEKPVPPGCVYVTIEECGILSSNWGKLLFAFEDKPVGIREKLKDPIRYKRELTAHFGRDFHIHYPEAEEHGDRTYLDCIHYPFLAWRKDGCKIGKSGVLSLEDNNVFVNEKIPTERPYNEEQVLKKIECPNVTDEDLHKLLDGSKFPTYEMIKNDLAYLDKEPLTYAILKDTMDKYAFTQSWSFKMFPGIHYNFSCRDIAKHSIENERVNKRRRLSIASRVTNIDKMSDEDIKGDYGFSVFSGYVDAGVMPLISKMIERGVDVNRKDEDGKTLLQKSAARFKKLTVKELLKAPGIDKTGVPEEKKTQFREEANDLIALVKGSSGGYRRRKKTRVRSKRIRKTRRRSKV
jgi:hypothetical protein